MLKKIVFFSLISFECFAYLNVFPTFVNFGSVEVDSFGRRDYISIRNTSNQTTIINVRSSCFSDFYVTDFMCRTLRPMESCRIEVEYRPRRVGSSSCDISVTDQTGSYQSIYVRGNGVER